MKSHGRAAENHVPSAFIRTYVRPVLTVENMLNGFAKAYHRLFSFADTV
jgi:hypothetical protein